MKCFYHSDQALHAPPRFLLRGQPAASPEGPVRAELLTQGLAKAGLVLTAPEEVDSPRLRKRLEQIHPPRYLTFLETIYTRWQALPNAAEFVAPNIHPCGGGHHYPRHPIGQAAGTCTIWPARSARPVFKARWPRPPPQRRQHKRC